MKQYILALRSLDFVKSGKNWSTDAIDLYNNNSYTNYSITRSRFGIDTIGDKTFVGTKVIADATPTVVVGGATPVTVTNYGEIVKETGVIKYNKFYYDEISGQYYIFNLIDDASPYYVLDRESVDLDLYRFIDTSSTIDILNYKGAFTNVNGTDEPIFTLKVYESESPSGPWMLSSVSSEIGTLFIQDAKRYCKLELEIESELQSSDVENFGFVLILEVAIADPITPVLSNSAKNILNRFPSWMKLYEDSIDQATPNNYIPQTVGGQFINALVSDYPENFEKQKNLFELDKTITTADANQLSWIYSTTDVSPSHLRVTGDNVPLVRLNKIEDLYEARENDYCYYFNVIDREIITIKLFTYLSVDGSILEQTPALKWNWFDEFGTRVGLKRLYLEENSNFKLRILDVYKNLPSVNEENFKVTLRRELDIWSAYGATPDSDYLGATPEVIEISDMENSTPYFSYSGKALKPFKDFVKNINEKYPVNWGYVKWQNGYWDYAGEDQTGVGRIEAVYDESASPLGKYYQPGVGDINDALLISRKPFEEDVEINSKFRAYGFEKVDTRLEYSPVEVAYEYYGSYRQEVYENEAATVNFRYAVDMPVHGSYVSAKTFYADITVNPANAYSPTHPASPEYNLVPIFDDQGYTLAEHTFYDISNNDPYSNSSSPLFSTKINLYEANKLSATPLVTSSSYNLKFADATPVTSSVGQPVNVTKEYFSITSANVKVVSNKYNKVSKTFYTSPKIPGNAVINFNNDNDLNEDVELDRSFIHNNVVFPPGATPLYVHIDNDIPFGFLSYQDPDAYIAQEYLGYGGVSNSYSLSDYYFVPSSPNIIASFVEPNFATPDQHFGYINTVGSTANYYFASLKYPYGSTPNKIILSTGESSSYPLEVDEWASFTADTENIIEGSVNRHGVVRTDPDNKDNNFTKNSNVVGKYDLSYDDFGINPEDYLITKIEPVNNNESVNLTIPSQFVYRDTDDQTFFPKSIIEDSNNNINGIEVSAEYVPTYDSFIHTGWYSQEEQDYYIYSSPVEEYHVTPGFNIVLDGVSRQGAPLIVERTIQGSTPVQLREVAFYNAATPSHINISNEEIIYANASNNIYLGYENIYDVTVVDNTTGYTLIANGSSQTNEVEVFSSATPSIKGRDYTVTYKVADSYAVDNDFYDIENEKYTSKLIFDSTPSSNVSYSVVYESSIVENSTPISLTVNPLKLWDQEGFVYLSHNDYNFSSAIVELNPSYIIDIYEDIMSMTINSLDVNGNAKPYQTFRITGDYVSSEEEYITTDINGFAHTIIRYSGATPSSTPGSYILVEGVENGSPEASENSQTEGYSNYVNFDIVTNYDSRNNIKAIVDTPSILADGIGTQYIRGIITSPATPISNNIVYWRKGRTVSDVFDATPYSDYVVSNERGEFTVGPIVVENSTNPGFWIVAVETEHSTTVNQDPNTVSGDIVYWNEKYDNLNYHISNAIIYNPNVLLNQGVEMYSTPNFTVNYNDGTNATPSTITPNWIPPKWYPLNRYDQYQMGLLGYVADEVQTYNNLINDYEEE
jgi:hypothetical protein